jgi:WD40 repeat protein
VSALAFNPKNRDVLVSGSGDGTAKLWDFVTQKSGEGKVLEAARKPTTIAIKTIESNMKAVTCLSWHPDGTVLAVGGSHS